MFYFFEQFVLGTFAFLLNIVLIRLSLTRYVISERFLTEIRTCSSAEKEEGSLNAISSEVMSERPLSCYFCPLHSIPLYIIYITRNG